jgi:hypothetical protein
MELEYELTRDDLYAFQWRAAFTPPRARRVRRWVYLGWLLAIVLFSILPAIGSDGFVISRVSFTFLFIAYPAVVVAQWFPGAAATVYALGWLLHVLLVAVPRRIARLWA